MTIRARFQTPMRLAALLVAAAKAAGRTTEVGVHALRRLDA